jgi:acyl-CoA thioesterase-1
MKKVMLLLLTGLAMASSSAFAATVLVVGDSISAAYGMHEDDGWVQLAENQLLENEQQVEFVNASISGDTTEGALRRLPDALERFEPDILVIELGGNDALRGYSLKKVRENLEALANMGKDAGADVLIMGMQIPTNYGAAYTKKFAQTFVDAAESTGSELIPFFLEPIALNIDYFQRDGIHPSEQAQPLLVEHAFTKLLPMLEALN